MLPDRQTDGRNDRPSTVPLATHARRGLIKEGERTEGRRVGEGDERKKERERDEEGMGTWVVGGTRAVVREVMMFRCAHYHQLPHAQSAY